jgi:hypothetical protein
VFREKEVTLLAEFEHATGTITRLKDQLHILEEQLHVNTEELELLQASREKARESIGACTNLLLGAPEKLRELVNAIAVLKTQEPISLTNLIDILLALQRYVSFCILGFFFRSHESSERKKSSILWQLCKDGSCCVVCLMPFCLIPILELLTF